MEGEYSGLEHEAKKGVVESLKVFFLIIYQLQISDSNFECRLELVEVIVFKNFLRKRVRLTVFGSKKSFTNLQSTAISMRIDLQIVTRTNIERIARFAFEYAVIYKRKKVTAVHKANIQKLADGLFLRVGIHIFFMFQYYVIPFVFPHDLFVGML